MSGASSSAHQRRRSADRIDADAVRRCGAGPAEWLAETGGPAATDRGAGTAAADAGAIGPAAAGLPDIGLSGIAPSGLAPAGATPPEDDPSGVPSDPDGAAPARAVPDNGLPGTDPDGRRPPAVPARDRSTGPAGGRLAGRADGPSNPPPAGASPGTDPDGVVSAEAIPEGSLPAGSISPGTANFPGRILRIFAATTPPALAIQTAQ
jgi:hypothetical protein